MNPITRAMLSIARKWKRTAFLFGLILAVATLAISGLAVSAAQEEQEADLRGATGASFTLAGYNDWTLHTIPQETVDEIAAMDGIKAHNASSWGIGAVLDGSGDALEVPKPLGDLVANDFYTTGCTDSEYASTFLSGAFRLVEGHHLTGDSNEIIIGKEAAENNGIAVGDTVSFRDGDNGEPVECTVAGLFEVLADGEDEKPSMSRPSTLYDYEDYAFISLDTLIEARALYADEWASGHIQSVDFFVEDAAELDGIVERAKDAASLDWDNYYVEANGEVYERVAGTLENSGSLVSWLVALVAVASAVVMALVLLVSTRARKREIGVLLAEGFSKRGIICQHLVEAFVVAAAALTIAYLASGQLAGPVGALFGKAAGSVSVDPSFLVTVAGAGAALLVAAVAVSCIPMLRMQPREILSQME